MQNLLLCPNPDIRLKTYNLLVERFSNRETLYEHFTKLPKYKLSLATFVNYFRKTFFIYFQKAPSLENCNNILQSQENNVKTESTLPTNSNKLPLYFTITPQLSVFHSPLLSFIDKFKLIMKGFSKNYYK